jgi:hypothetical protein
VVVLFQANSLALRSTLLYVVLWKREGRRTGFLGRLAATAKRKESDLIGEL